MALPEASYPLEPLEPMEVEETKVPIALQAIAEDSHEPPKKTSPNPIWHSRRP